MCCILYYARFIFHRILEMPVVIETEADAQTSSRAALGGGIGGGAVALAAILVVGLILFRRRKVNLRNQRKTPETEPENLSALYATGFRKRNAYIAALGPMAKQLGDFGQFWRMVWQQKVEKIVMVTNFVEGEKTKCEQYWPDHGQRKLYGDIEVVCKVERLYADFIWRQLTLSKGKHNFEERNLQHLQFTAWPDKDIPDDVTSIIEFRQKVNALPSTFNGPVIVHC
ncbi:PTPRC-like protein, partial [Mya arenaria]